MYKLAVCFGVRYDAELVEDAKENMKDFADEFCILDDTKRTDLWRNEQEYRYKLRRMAIEKGCDWMLITSPDERWEKNAAKIIKKLIKFKKKIIYRFNLRELWTPDEYRIDGIWGEKTRGRLYPVYPNQVFEKTPIQCPPYPVNPVLKGECQFREAYPFENIDLNIYHLKMINPENRKTRAEIFKKLDPEDKFQQIGYDYLCDETGLQLEKIPEGREYSPEYKPYTFKVPQLCK
jgi:hypothetical protein